MQIPPGAAAPKLVGKIDGHRIYDAVDYKGDHIISVAEGFERDRNGDKLVEQLWTKYIFVERKPGRFCEIYSLEKGKDDLLDYSPSTIIRAGSRSVIATDCEVFGTGHPQVQDYFLLLSDGRPYRLPVEDRVKQALKQVLPKGREIWKGDGVVLERMCYAQAVYRDGDANCCPTAGSVMIKFAFSGDDLVVVSKAYDPKSDGLRSACWGIPTSPK